MTIGELLTKLNEICPFQIQEDFDNSGLQVGNPDNPCARILLGFDFTEDLLREAIKEKADVIITHHPFLFRGLKTIDTKNWQGKQIYSLIQSNIGLIALHTNLDKIDFGVNMQLAKDLGLMNLTVFLPEEGGVGLGTIGELPTPMPLEDFVTDVKERLNRPGLKYVGDHKIQVKRVGVLGGAGAEFIEEAKARNLDVYISSDFKYHDAQKAQNIKMAIIDAGHFGTEVGVVKALGNKLKEIIPQTEILVSQKMRDYWEYK